MIKGFQILDSRGNPTIMTVVKSKQGIGIASVPSGASTGIHEAYELRDHRKSYRGMSVLKAINNINNKINNALKGYNVEEQAKIDYTMIELDGTENKRRLGANAILSVSMAVARCAANEKGIELYEYLGGYNNMPTPLLNIINGGKHAGNKMKIQECMIIPDTKSFSEDIRIATEIYHTLKEVIEKKYGKSAINVGDEGGFAPPISKVEEAFELVLKAVEELGYSKKVGLGIDAAASEFYKNNRYYLTNRGIGKEKLLDYYKELVSKYPLWSIEDPFEQEDFETTAQLRKELKDKVQIVGDDLFTTNSKRIEIGIEKGSCNALLLKLNQIGTLTEAKKAMVLARNNGMKIVVSHRSGETCDDFISDLAVGWGAEEIKAGAPARGERVSKYNRLMIIEQTIM